MARGRKYLPPDPRPSRAHPEHRAARKKLERENSGYGWVPPVILGLVGLTLAFDITKDVERAEERHRREGAEGEQRRREGGRRRRRGGGGDGDAGKSERDDRRDGEDYEGGDEDDGYGGGGVGLDRGDRLERGEGGSWDGDGEWERERERERRGRRRNGHEGYDDYYYEDDVGYSRRGRDDGYDFGLERGRRALDDRSGRPRMRRRSSDW